MTHTPSTPQAGTPDHGPAVVALCGSQRADGKTRAALRRALATAEAADAPTDLVDLRAFGLPVYDADRPDARDADVLGEELVACVRRGDAPETAPAPLTLIAPPPDPADAHRPSTDSVPL